MLYQLSYTRAWTAPAYLPFVRPGEPSRNTATMVGVGFEPT